MENATWNLVREQSFLYNQLILKFQIGLLVEIFRLKFG